MRRWIAAAAAALVVFVAGVRPAVADPTAPVTVPADAIGVAIAQVNSPGLAVTLDSGGSEQHDIVVSNHTPDLRLTVKLTATDATGSLGANAASWLAFSDDAIQLEPHAATTVSLTVAVPDDTQPGSALAHVTATVESAAAAADGSPVTGTTQVTFPVAITVRGTPTAQIAVADVHRDDKGSRHQLALVLRNYGSQGASVRGHVVVASGQPQTIPFSAELAPSGDTTINLPWKAPPKGTPADLAVDVEYGNGSVASWSSTLGGPPTTLVPNASANASAAAVPSPTTAPADGSSDNSSAASSSSSSSWKPNVVYLIVAAIVLAGLWFVFEMRRSKRREQELPIMPPFWMAPPASGSDATAELAKQLVRLTEIIVEMATNQDARAAPPAAPARARSPDVESGGDMPPPDRGPPASERASPRVVPLRAEAAEPPEAPVRPETETPARSASSTPSAEPRSEFSDGDPRATALSRLMALEAERRRLRRWMDEEDSELIPDFSEARPAAPAPDQEFPGES